MLWTPQTLGPSIVDNYGIVGAAAGTAVTCNATTLLDGAVTELISAASNVQDSWGIAIFIDGTGASATAAQACVDILIGGATDDVLVAALICGQANLGQGGRHYTFPLHIPKGVRIAATHANVRTSITARIGIALYGGTPPPWRVGSRVTTYGTQINNARGQAVTPAQSGAAASVTEMTASTSRDHFAFLPGFQAATDTTLQSRTFNIGIGVGAAPEQRIGTWFMAQNTTENQTGPYPTMCAFTPVASGSRLTMLVSNSGTNDAAYDGLIYAVS